MTLPASGAIAFSDVNTELSYSSTAQISLNDTAVRTLFGISSGAIDMNSGHGKSSASYWIVSTSKYQVNNNQSDKLIIFVTGSYIWLTAGLSNGGSYPGIIFWKYDLTGSVQTISGGSTGSLLYYTYPTSYGNYAQTVTDGTTAWSFSVISEQVLKTSLSGPSLTRAWWESNPPNGFSSGALDSSGNIYAGLWYPICSSYGPNVPALIKYNTSGVVQWASYYQFGSNGTNSGFTGLVCSGSYIYGIWSDAGGNNWFLEINQSNGSVVSVYYYHIVLSGKGYSWDNSQGGGGPTKLSYNSSVGFATTGFSIGGGITLSLLNASGSSVWHRLISPGWSGGSLSTSGHHGTSTIDINGNVYSAVWQTSNQIDSVWSSNPAIVITKFNSSGTTQWNRGIFIQSPGTELINVQSVTLEASPTGDIVIAFEFFNNNSGYQYPVVIHYPASGSKYGSTLYTIVAGSGWTVQINTWSPTITTPSISGSSASSTVGSYTPGRVPGSMTTAFSGASGGSYSSTFVNL